MKPKHVWAAAATASFLGWRAIRRHRRDIELTDRVALITGGTRGLGLYLARELARQGCKLVICARDEEELACARQDLEPRGARLLAVRCDVGVPEDVQSLVAQANARFGQIDILINNAGIIQVGPLATMTVDDFAQAMATNFWGGVHTTLAVLPQMRARKSGRIVNITSIGGQVPVPHLLPYDCAKFAAQGFSEGLHAELAADGIVVTTVVPGLMRTGGPRHAFYKGARTEEHAWFAAADSMPITSMSAVSAARRIVLACRRGESQLTLTWQAKLLRLVHALLPGMTTELLGQVSRLLPGSSGPSPRLALRGATVEQAG
ncbi:MAG TPA: SDR family oxidoreductase [Gemmatimonadales bacterium]|nr:SDR family oxidoreductase [Gemmatimonadales bacterium]